MVIEYLVIFLISLLVFLTYQDIKTRRIHVVLPICIFITGFIINTFSDELFYKYVFQNLIFVVVNIVFLLGYYSLKKRKIFNPIDTEIGLGDIIFFLAITPLFELKSYISFFIISLLVSLIIHSISTVFSKSKTIPLAGYMSIFLGVYLISNYFLNINPITIWN